MAPDSRHSSRGRQPDTSQGSAASVEAVLRHADRRMRATAPDDIHSHCAIVRRAVEALAPVDALYVALYRDESTMIVAYCFADQTDLGPDTCQYSRGSLSHWIRASAKPYRFGDDHGRLLRGALPMGAGARSSDVLAVPIFSPQTDTVIGQLNVQSETPSAFGEEFLEAVQWLARALAVTLAPEARAAQRADLYRDFPQFDSTRLNTPVDLLNVTTERLEDVVGHLDELAQDVARLAGADGAREGLDRVRSECRRLGTELAMMVANSPAEEAAGDRAAQLTEREAEVAHLIATQGLGNQAIARRLTISEKTVKAHVSHILTKLGCRQRSELAWVLGHRGRD